MSQGEGTNDQAAQRKKARLLRLMLILMIIFSITLSVITILNQTTRDRVGFTIDVPTKRKFADANEAIAYLRNRHQFAVDWKIKDYRVFVHSGLLLGKRTYLNQRSWPFMLEYNDRQFYRFRTSGQHGNERWVYVHVDVPKQDFNRQQDIYLCPAWPGVMVTLLPDNRGKEGKMELTGDVMEFWLASYPIDSQLIEPYTVIPSQHENITSDGAILFTKDLQDIAGALAAIQEEANGKYSLLVMMDDQFGIDYLKKVKIGERVLVHGFGFLRRATVTQIDSPNIGIDLDEKPLPGWPADLR